MAALQDYNKLIVHVNSLLYSYSLDILARVSQGQSTPQALEASLETIAGQDNPVIFFRAGELLKRMIGGLSNDFDSVGLLLTVGGSCLRK